jgi:hypothetical protein
MVKLKNTTTGDEKEFSVDRAEQILRISSRFPSPQWVLSGEKYKYEGGKILKNAKRRKPTPSTDEQGAETSDES